MTRGAVSDANRQGVNLIEVMVCTCIIGLLAAIATPFYLS